MSRVTNTVTNAVTNAVTDNVTDVETRVLCSIVDGRLDHAALRSLPRWRAVLLAQVAFKARVMTRADRDKLVREAAVLGEVKPLRK